MTSPGDAPPPFGVEGDLFAPPAALRTGLALLALGLLIGAAALLALAAWPAWVRAMVALALVLAAWVAWLARRRCVQSYLVTERGITVLHHGVAQRALAFAEVSDLREHLTWWGGRRLRLRHEAGPLDIDLSFLGKGARILFATLRYRMRPQFYRWVDDILSHGQQFSVRPGARLVLVFHALIAALLGWLVRHSLVGWVAVPAAAGLILLQIDAMTTVVRLGPEGLALRTWFRRRRVTPGDVQGFAFQSRTRLFRPAERIIVLQCRKFDLRLSDALQGFEALAGAIEGFARLRETRGLAQL